MSKLPGKLAAVDHNTQRVLAKAQRLLPRLKLSYEEMAQRPDASAVELAHLRNAIGELEQTIDSIRFRPHGAKGIEPEAQPFGKSAARGASGRFAPVGSRDHYEAHRRAWVGKRDSGEASGAEAYREHVSDDWHESKEDHQRELLKELLHLQADVHGLTGPERKSAQRRIRELQQRLGRSE